LEKGGGEWVEKGEKLGDMMGWVVCDREIEREKARAADLLVCC